MAAKYKFGEWRLGEDGKIKCINEHVLVAEKALGRKLRGTEQVHHIDGNPRNNENVNLVICPDMAYHKLIHRRAEAYDACGNASFVQCHYCRQWDSLKNMGFHSTGVTYHNACKNASNAKYKAARKVAQSEGRKREIIESANKLLDAM